MVETVNQNKYLEESDGAVLESRVGAIRLFPQSYEYQRINYLVRAYNSMMVGKWSLNPSYHILTTKTMKASAKNQVPFPLVNGLDSGIDALKKALAYSDVDESEVSPLIEEALIAGQKLLIDEKTSLPYFRNNIYRKDGLEGAQVVLPRIKGDYERLIPVMEKIGDYLFTKQKSHAEKSFSYHEDKADKLGYQALDSLNVAQELIEYLSEEGYKKRIVYADRIAVELDYSLKKFEALLLKNEINQDGSIGWKQIHTQLTEMLAQYRQFKIDGKKASYNRMVKRYSEAVMAYNQSL